MCKTSWRSQSSPNDTFPLAALVTATFSSAASGAYRTANINAHTDKQTAIKTVNKAVNFSLNTKFFMKNSP